MVPHAVTHGKVWYVGVPRSHLTETFLAPLEKMLPGEKEAKQPQNHSVIPINQARAGPV